MTEKVVLSNTFTFNINIDTPTGGNFSGSFTMHRPNVKEWIQIGKIAAQETESLGVNGFTSQLAHMLGVFDTLVDKAPKWWIPREIYEVEVLQAVYAEYVERLNRFSEKPEPEGTSEGTDSKVGVLVPAQV